MKVLFYFPFVLLNFSTSSSHLLVYLHKNQNKNKQTKLNYLFFNYCHDTDCLLLSHDNNERNLEKKDFTKRWICEREQPNCKLLILN